MLIDTIGFISHLPHELVESFKSTLEEILYADVLIHVVDISNPMWEYQSKVVYSVLDELYPDKSYEKKIFEVWNKIDLVTDLEEIKLRVSMNKYRVVPISAKERVNLNKLIKEIKLKVDEQFGKSPTNLKVSFESHEKVLNWLRM